MPAMLHSAQPLRSSLAHSLVGLNQSSSHLSSAGASWDTQEDFEEPATPLPSPAPARLAMLLEVSSSLRFGCVVLPPITGPYYGSPDRRWLSLYAALRSSERGPSNAPRLRLSSSPEMDGAGASDPFRTASALGGFEPLPS